jgi:hypothetical protein
MLTFWKRSSKMVLDANPSFREEYFNGTPAPGDAYNEAVLAANKGKRLPIVGRVEVYIVEEQQPRYLAYLNNEFDMLERLPAEFANIAIPGNELAGDLKRRGMQMQRTPGIELTYSYFGMKDPIVGGYEPEKVALRRAMVLGQDIDAEIKIARKNQAIIAHSPIGPGASATTPTSARPPPSTTRRRRRRSSTCTGTSTATVMAFATCRGNLPRTPARPSASNSPPPPPRNRSRSTRTGRRTWTPSAST